MEQLPARCWMWSRRREAGLSSSGYDESWEEQAFAEDTAGSLGGCVWPPRSYSCSFCQREFRSAQALGGHMNVHRRDRARLKQQSPPNSVDTTFQTQNLKSDHPLLFDSFHHDVDECKQKNHHHQVCSSFKVDYNNPNPNSAHHYEASCPEKNLLRTLSSSSPSNSSLKSCSSSDLPTETTDQHHDRIIRKRCRTADLRRHDDEDDNLSVSLNLFVRPATRPASQEEDEAADRVGCKRKRTIENWALPGLLLKPVASSPSTSIDHGLDLELRLGGTAA